MFATIKSITAIHWNKNKRYGSVKSLSLFS